MKRDSPADRGRAKTLAVLVLSVREGHSCEAHSHQVGSFACTQVTFVSTIAKVLSADGNQRHSVACTCPNQSGSHLVMRGKSKGHIARSLRLADTGSLMARMQRACELLGESCRLQNRSMFDYTHELCNTQFVCLTLSARVVHVCHRGLLGPIGCKSSENWGT